MAILLPLLPSQEIVTINELINESTDAAPDSAVTEPKPGGHKGYPTPLSPPGHRRLGWGRFKGMLGKVCWEVVEAPT